MFNSFQHLKGAFSLSRLFRYTKLPRFVASRLSLSTQSSGESETAQQVESTFTSLTSSTLSSSSKRRMSFSVLGASFLLMIQLALALPAKAVVVNSPYSRSATAHSISSDYIEDSKEYYALLSEHDKDPLALDDEEKLEDRGKGSLAKGKLAKEASAQVNLAGAKGAKGNLTSLGSNLAESLPQHKLTKATTPPSGWTNFLSVSVSSLGHKESAFPQPLLVSTQPFLLSLTNKMMLGVKNFFANNIEVRSRPRHNSDLFDDFYNGFLVLVDEADLTDLLSNWSLLGKAHFKGVYYKGGSISGDAYEAYLKEFNLYPFKSFEEIYVLPEEQYDKITDRYVPVVKAAFSYCLPGFVMVFEGERGETFYGECINKIQYSMFAYFPDQENLVTLFTNKKGEGTVITKDNNAFHLKNIFKQEEALRHYNSFRNYSFYRALVF